MLLHYQNQISIAQGCNPCPQWCREAAPRSEWVCSCRDRPIFQLPQAGGLYRVHQTFATGCYEQSQQPHKLYEDHELIDRLELWDSELEVSLRLNATLGQGQQSHSEESYSVRDLEPPLNSKSISSSCASGLELAPGCSLPHSPCLLEIELS